MSDRDIEAIKKAVPRLPSAAKAPIKYEDAVALVRHMRLATTYGSNMDSEYAMGFFRGWTTACGAILSALGDSPNKWMKDEDR